MVDAWRPGHPNFSPFKINLRVIKKIHQVGNQLRDKLLLKFEGPFVVTKVQSNGMSYEVTGGSLGNKIVKVNHRHLQEWCDYLSYIVRYLLDDDMNALESDTVCDDLYSIKDSDSDLSDGVRYNLFSEASIVSRTNSADCEIENENVVELAAVRVRSRYNDLYE